MEESFFKKKLEPHLNTELFEKLNTSIILSEAISSHQNPKEHVWEPRKLVELYLRETRNFHPIKDVGSYPELLKHITKCSVFFQKGLEALPENERMLAEVIMSPHPVTLYTDLLKTVKEMRISAGK